MSNDRYTKEAALELIRNLRDYATQTRNGAGDALTSIIHGGWRDAKSGDFQNALREVILDVRNAANMVDEYSNHLEEKIRRF